MRILIATSMVLSSCNVLTPKKDKDPSPASFTQSGDALSREPEVIVTTDPFGPPSVSERDRPPAVTGEEGSGSTSETPPSSAPGSETAAQEEAPNPPAENGGEEPENSPPPPFLIKPLPVETRIDDNFIPFGQESEDARRDLTRIRLENAASLPFTRYISVGFLDMSDLTSDQNSFVKLKSSVINSVSFMLNSLSTNIFLRAPVPVSGDFSLLRIDIRDYNWSFNDWEFLVRANQNVQGKEDYPYRNSFDPVFNDLVSLTGSSTPVVRADWLANEMSLPGVYSRLADLPDTLNGLEQQLNTDTIENISQTLLQPDANPRAVRSYLSSQNTGMSLNNRITERHPANSGSLWLSYDFQAPDQNPESDAAARPLGPAPDIFDPTSGNSTGQSFDHDLSTAIFNLPNGLPAFFMANSNGNRLNTASPSVLLDPDDFDDTGLMRSPRSCIRCHSTGIRGGAGDEMRNIMNSGLNADLFSDFILEGTLSMHVEKSSFDALVTFDNNRISTAIEGTRVIPEFGGSLAATSLYLDNLSVGDLASELNITESQFRRIEARLSDGLRLAILPAGTGGLDREVFEELFDNLLLEIFNLRQ